MCLEGTDYLAGQVEHLYLLGCPQTLHLCCFGGMMGWMMDESRANLNFWVANGGGAWLGGW